MKTIGLLIDQIRPVYFVSAVILINLLTGCQSDIPPMVSLGIDDIYYIPRMKARIFRPAFTGETYRWSMRRADGTDTILSVGKEYTFLAKDTGSYHLSFEIIDRHTPYKHEFTCIVIHEQVEYSPYISKVYEYRPAPGQFVNTMPEYREGDTEEDMRKKAEENLSGTNDVMVTLGAYGGYIVFGFDHTIMNVKGKKDLMILANAFYSDLPFYKERKGGSCEPGIVEVAFDVNQNGIPDDPWYELAGSEYGKPETLKQYEIVYHRPAAHKQPQPDMSQQLSDVTYILWKDNHGQSGYVSKNIYHTQNYYPGWISEEILRFRGTRLKSNATDESGIGTYYVLYSYPWGYVDNHPNEYKNLNAFDIDWAVNDKGDPVYLSGIDFVKVYTAVNQYCGWIGETSTEIIRAQDLHIPTASLPAPLDVEKQEQYRRAIARRNHFSIQK